MVLHWNCIRINIHESINVILKSVVMMKPLQLCIFIHNLWSLCLYFFLFITFLCFNGMNLQHILPPISDNHHFSFSIFFLILILDAFNHLASNYLCLWFNSRILYVLFPISSIHFSSTVNISSLSIIFPTLITFLDLPNFWNMWQPVISHFFAVDLSYIHCYLNI